DVGDGTGLSTGDGSALSSGILPYPTLGLEILVGTSTRTQTRAPLEVGKQLGRDFSPQIEGALLSRADAVAPSEAAASLFLDARMPAESGLTAAGIAVPIEAGASMRSEAETDMELLPALRIDASSPIEAARSALVKADAVVPVDILRDL